MRIDHQLLERELGEYIQVGHRLYRTREVDLASLETRGDYLFMGNTVFVVKGGQIIPVSPEQADPAHVNSEKDQLDMFAVVADSPYLHIEITGRYCGREASKVLEKAGRHYDAQVHKGLLLELPGLILDGDIAGEYYLVHDMICSGFHRMGKVAFVSPGCESEFFETTARNRMIDIRFFSDREPADSWLLQTRAA